MNLREAVAGRDPIRLRLEDHTYLVARASGEEVELGPSVSCVSATFWGAFNAPLMARRCGPAARKRATGNPDASDKELEAAWKANGDAAAERGTAIHLIIEAYLLARNPEHGPPPPDADPLCPIVASWIDAQYPESEWDTIPEMIVYGRVYDGGRVIPGTIDLVAVNRLTGRVTLVDWKTGSVDDTKGRKDGLFGLPGTRMAKYSLQLGIYKLILEREYGAEVEALEVVQVTLGETPTVHPAKPEYTDDLCVSIVAITP